MADIPPDTDVTTERNHSRDGGEDQQQSAVLPPPPRHRAPSMTDDSMYVLALSNCRVTSRLCLDSRVQGGESNRPFHIFAILGAHLRPDLSAQNMKFS